MADGQQLVIGLEELQYNQVYGSCVPNATADYPLPDLTNRRPDNIICAADPFNLTVCHSTDVPSMLAFKL